MLKKAVGLHKLQESPALTIERPEVHNERVKHLNIDEMKAVEPQPIQVREERPSWDRPPPIGMEDRVPRPSNYERGADRNRPPRRDEAEMGAGKE